MFAPIGAFPIGELEQLTDTPAIASGSLDVSGSATAKAAVTAAASASLSISGAATSQSGYVEAGSLLGLGPIGSGAIGEGFAASTPLTSVSGSASGAVQFTGTATGIVPIFGRAPDIVLAQWSVAPTDAGAVISSAPNPPTTPAWNVTIGAPGFTVIDAPNYLSQAASVPFLGISLSAQASAGLTLLAAGAFSVTGQAAGIARAGASASGQILLDGFATGAAIVRGNGAGAVPITGQATAVIGAAPISGSLTATFDIGGALVGAAPISGVASGAFTVVASGAVGTEIFGAMSAVLDLFATAAISEPSQRRAALPRESLNGGRVLSNQTHNILEG